MQHFYEIFSNLLQEAQITFDMLISTGWTAWVTLLLILFFFFGVMQSLRTYLRVRYTIRHQIDAKKKTLLEVKQVATAIGGEIPFLLILVPARDESAVIANTINRLTNLDYPTERYAVVVITDEREKSSDGILSTYDIATVKANELNRGLDDPWLYVVDVPEWYSGHFGSAKRTFMRSTKGRALNFVLQYIQHEKRLSQADMLGILDADGRLHQKVLLEVAYKRLHDDAKVLQGPVFQISNYRDVTLIGKAAGIELSIYHLSTLAYRLQRKKLSAEFLAGTNYFIDLKMMIELDGWNQHALVEDAELGLRLFLQKKLKPMWLSCYEIEQTPPDKDVYLKQRERWALGHFQLLPMIRNSSLSLKDKIILSFRVLSSILKSPLDIGLPVLGWIALFLGWTQGFPEWAGWIMMSLFIGSIFVWDFFGRGYRMLEKYAPVQLEQDWEKRRMHQFQFIAAMPWLIFLQAWPRLVAFYKYLTDSGDASWVKTKRTIEEPVEVAASLVSVEQCDDCLSDHTIKKEKYS